MFVRIMLSLMFATEEELGYDQTVQRRLNRETETICFVYQVQEHFYKTIGAICEHRSLCTTDRATRVWAVVEVKSFDDLEPCEGGRPLVLKDVWLDSDAMTERDILMEISEALKKVADILAKGGELDGFEGMDEDSKKALRDCLNEGEDGWNKYFLTIVHDWEGMRSKDLAPAAQPNDKLFVLPPSAVRPASIPHADSVSRSQSSTSHPANLAPLAPVAKPVGLPRWCSAKRQYREVFAEVCVALHDVPKLTDVVTALLDCVFGEALWPIHR